MLADFFKQFDWSWLGFFVLLVLPGFISIQVWTYIFPSAERPLKDEMSEALAFGVLNAAFVAPILVAWTPTDPKAVYFALVAGLVVLPVLWPFLLRWAIDVLQRFNIILIPSRSAWDYAFSSDRTFFVIVHLKDGRMIGGYYGENSFAGVYPSTGHIYLEELWTLDATGTFIAAVPDSAGIVLRPSDYAFVELKAAN